MQKADIGYRFKLLSLEISVSTHSIAWPQFHKNAADSSANVATILTLEWSVSFKNSHLSVIQSSLRQLQAYIADQVSPCLHCL